MHTGVVRGNWLRDLGSQLPSQMRICDGKVMEEIAEFGQCDGVLDRIACVFIAASD